MVAEFWKIVWYEKATFNIKYKLHQFRDENKDFGKKRQCLISFSYFPPAPFLKDVGYIEVLLRAKSQ